MAADDLGNTSVVFDPPTDLDDNPAPSAATEGVPEKAPAETTVDTDQVDREIEHLKDERSRLQQELQGAAGNDVKEKQLKRQLSQLDEELAAKDNDTYRKQHASITEG